MPPVPHVYVLQAAVSLIAGQSFHGHQAQDLDFVSYADRRRSPIHPSQPMPLMLPLLKKPVVVVAVQEPDGTPLFQQGPAGHRAGLLLGTREGGHEDGHQQSNDRDHNQELDQGEGLVFLHDVTLQRQKR
jgi:hypothetical protein